MGASTRKCHLGLNEDKAESENLGTRATQYDGELSGIAQGLEGAREVSMLVVLRDSKPAISALEETRQGTRPTTPQDRGTSPRETL